MVGIGAHRSLWVPIGSVCIALVCLGIPAASFASIWSRRRALHTVHVMQTYGFIYRRFNPNRHYWQAVTQTQTLLLVVVDVFGRTMPVVTQAVLQQLVLVVSMVLNGWFTPMKQQELANLEFISFAVLTLTVTLGLVCVPPVGSREPLSQAGYAGIGAVVLFINAALVAYLAWFIWKHFAAADRKAEQAGEEGQAGDREGEEVQEGPNRVSGNGQHAGRGSKSPSPSPSRGRGLFGMVRKGGEHAAGFFSMLRQRKGGSAGSDGGGGGGADAGVDGCSNGHGHGNGRQQRQAPPHLQGAAVGAGAPRPADAAVGWRTK